MGKNELKWGVWFLTLAGLVWGLVGLGYFLNTNLNIVNLVLGSVPALENLLYLVVGICAVSVAYFHIKKGEK